MKLLAWIMSRFNVSPELIGDITEDASRRSNFWLLRQSTVAILSTASADLWRHKLRTLVAMALAWTLWAAFPFVEFRLYNPQFYPFALLLMLISWWAFVVGLTVSRVHPAQPLGAALFFVATAYVWIVPTIARTVETMYVYYPFSRTYILPVLFQMLAQNGSFVFFTLFGATAVRSRKGAVA